MDLYIYFPIRLYGVVPNLLGTETSLPLISSMCKMLKVLYMYMYVHTLMFFLIQDEKRCTSYCSTQNFKRYTLHVTVLLHSMKYDIYIYGSFGRKRRLHLQGRQSPTLR
jgi:hypothetical protein